MAANTYIRKHMKRNLRLVILPVLLSAMLLGCASTQEIPETTLPAQTILETEAIPVSIQQTTVPTEATAAPTTEPATEPATEPGTEPATEPGTEPAAQAVPTEAEGTDYVLNANTKKFHHIWCSSVKTIKEKNRRDFTGTREDVIAKGYQACKRCNP